MKTIMKHYYKAKEFVLNQLKERGKDASYEIGNHVIYTAYYAIKHDIGYEDMDAYIDSVIEKTNKKLWNCGCQCSLVDALGNKESYWEGGGDCIRYAKEAFRKAVSSYYAALKLYNEAEEDGINDEKQE